MHWRNLQNPRVLAVAALAVSAGVLGYNNHSPLFMVISVIAFLVLLAFLSQPAPLYTPRLRREHGPTPATATIYANTRPYTPPDLARTETDVAGLEGEDKVRKALQLLPTGYYVVFDAPLPASNDTIDAMIIGPTGIYVLAMVNWRGNFTLRNGHWFRMNGASPVAIMAANPFERLGEQVPFVEQALSKITGKPFAEWQQAQQQAQQTRFGQTFSLVNGAALLTHPDSRLTTDHTGFPTLRLPDLLHGIHEGYDILTPPMCAALFHALTGTAS